MKIKGDIMRIEVVLSPDREVLERVRLSRKRIYQRLRFKEIGELEGRLIELEKRIEKIVREVKRLKRELENRGLTS